MRHAHTLPAGLLAFTILLAIVPVVFATTPGSSQPSQREEHFHGLVVQQRDEGRPNIPADLPVGWLYFDCYTDDPAKHTLTAWAGSNWQNMTVEDCVYYCNSKYLTFAGLENGQYCYCGNGTTIGSTVTSEDDCDIPCVGNINQKCGGINSLSIYWTGAPMESDAIIVEETAGGWLLMGCYNDSNNARTLTVTLTNVGDEYTNTVESCTGACGALGYSIAGVEFGRECWCDIIINQNRTALEDPAPCGVLTCSGDNTEFCGAADLLLAYTNKTVE